MPKLELTLNPGYVPGWDIWSAIRELIQNCADANDIGYPMKVVYNPNRKDPTLSFTNEGITLNRDALLLGTTTKLNDDRQRGCFGEGMKLAWLVLLRAGLKVWIKSGSEKWVPSIEYSENYKSDLLTVDIGNAAQENVVKVEIRGLAENLWEEFRSRILFSPGVELEKEDYIVAGRDRILTREDLRGNLFVKGLWVSKLPGQYWFGYDFYNLKLDRDRKLADPWDLKDKIRTALNAASEANTLSDEDLYLMLNQNKWEEQTIVADSWSNWQVGHLAQQIAARFHSEFGSDCVAVEDTTQSMEAAQHGMKSKVVSKAIKALVEMIDGKYENRRNDRATEFAKTYDFYELTQEERQNFFWARDCLKTINEDFKVNIVDFHGQSVLGTYRAGDISVAKKVLPDRSQLIATIVHEIAHRKGTDGSVEHRNECERLFGDIIHKLYIP
jgi:hypothetical protein